MNKINWLELKKKIFLLIGKERQCAEMEMENGTRKTYVVVAMEGKNMPLGW